MLKPDIIHAVLETFAGFALKRCRVKGAKKILTLQTTNTTFLKGPIIRAADQVTAISSVLVHRARQEGKDAVLIPNGIRLDLINHALSHRPKIDGRILFVGRLEQMKGVDTLLTAFAQLRGRTATSYENDPAARSSPARMRSDGQLAAIHLRIVGDGSERKHLEKLAHDLNIMDRVTFVGRLTPDKVADEFAQASIFCGLSRSEALGNVFLEAQAAGCAVIGTNVGGIPDIVKDGQTGFLVRPDDVSGVTGTMKLLLKDETLRSGLAYNGQKHAKDYDWGVIAKMYRAIYEDIDL